MTPVLLLTAKAGPACRDGKGTPINAAAKQEVRA